MAISPLQVFVRAKKLINQTFDELARYLKETRDFLTDCEITDELDHETRKDLQQVSNYLEQVSGITAVLSRDHMKVAFFGRTSNGKSTVINAMLQDKILPSGIGHTTNCFVTVMGCNGTEAYMNTPDSKEKRSVDSLQQLAHALGEGKIDSSSLIQVFWPKDVCTLLRDDVVFVDSPGIDVTPDLDSWIDKHCLDADVFVLVVNSESTLNQTEKSFFHKVNNRLSKPNVFILNNRWDASSDGDPQMMAKVKQQHLERTTNFLADELKCVNKREAKDRVFFVSALETLRHRMKQKRMQGQPAPAVNLQRSESIESDINDFVGEHRARLIEFENFEIKFQECISKSAITTKFESHASRGKGITSQLRLIMEQVVGRAYSQRRRCEAQKQDLEERLEYMTVSFETLTKEIKNKILNFSEEVEQQVAKAMSDEIRRLGYLVGDFDYPFHPHHGFLKTYKAELYSHIEKGLGKNLKARCSALLLDSIEEYKKEMRDGIHLLIPPNAESVIVQLTPRRDFEVSYELDVHSLCTDFQEDISFHFSLGWTNLVRRFLAPRNAKLAMLLGANISKSSPIAAIATAARQAKDQFQHEAEEEKTSSMVARRQDDVLEYPGRYDENELTVAVVHALASVTSTTSCGILVVAGLVWRTLGWKLIIGIVGGYGTLYVFERARWTNSAKENSFKKQLVSYASEKLQLVVSFTSKSCSHQVEQELSSTFMQLETEIKNSKSKLKKEIDELNIEMKRLEEVEAKAKVFRNKASWLDSELNGFIKEFGLSRSKI
eukprot:gene7126-12781_t